MGTTVKAHIKVLERNEVYSKISFKNKYLQYVFE